MYIARRSLPVLMFVFAALLLPHRQQAEDLTTQYWPMLSAEQVQGFMDSVSGETARDHIRYISQFWRWAPSRGFHDVAEYVVAKSRSYGLQDAHIERFPADQNTRYLGLTMYRPSWDPIAGDLWVVSPVKQKITSFADIPMTLAGYSRNTDVTAELVDVGAGTAPEDYANKDVKGKIVLGTGAVGLLQRMAVFQRGALGVLSAWTPELQTSRDPLDNPDAVTWGTGAAPQSNSGQPSTFGFMLSLRQRSVLQSILRSGKKVTVHATVKAEYEDPGYFEVATAVIPGKEFPDQEFVFSAHLEHPKPAANDNTSGSATLLEVARVLQEMISTGQVPPPKRTIRFLWVEEGRSTRCFLEKHPELVKKMFAVLNMDIVGNDQQLTKAILYYWLSPASHPSFANDVVQDFFELIQKSNNDRMPSDAIHPLVSPTGNRRPFIAQAERYARPSDQSIFVSLGVPGLNFAAWPDQYHHTQFDTPEKSDPTQLARVAFIGAASAVVLSTAGPENVQDIGTSSVGRAHQRIGEDVRKALRLLNRASVTDYAQARTEAVNTVHQGYLREQQNLESLGLLAGHDAAALDFLAKQEAVLLASEKDNLNQIEMTYQQSAKRRQPPASPSATESDARAAAGGIPHWNGRILDAEALWEQLPREEIDRLQIFSYTTQKTAPFVPNFNVILFETLNFIDGKRTLKEIRDAVSAEYEPIPLQAVTDLAEALVKANLIEVNTRQN